MDRYLNRSPVSFLPNNFVNIKRKSFPVDGGDFADLLSLEVSSHNLLKNQLGQSHHNMARARSNYS